MVLINNRNWTSYDPSFFARPAVQVAQDLLGKLLVCERGHAAPLVGRIVETEAYAQDDPACHAGHLVNQDQQEIPTKGRGHELFGPPGEAYVYLCYGMYWLLNVVTEPEGICGAVLIRAVEPLQGLDTMRTRRPAARKDVDLTNGPGKLTQAFGIDGKYHKKKLTRPPLYLAEPDALGQWPVATSSRIGISKGVDLPWRYFIEGNRFVSR